MNWNLFIGLLCVAAFVGGAVWLYRNRNKPVEPQVQPGPPVAARRFGTRYALHHRYEQDDVLHYPNFESATPGQVWSKFRAYIKERNGVPDNQTPTIDHLKDVGYSVKLIKD